MTRLRRVPLASATDLEKVVSDVCTNMLAGGYELVTSFVYQTELILIFRQK
jgi:hypothetical protein